MTRPATSRTILVVDDSATIRRVVARTLEDAGFEVFVAADGREALDLAAARPPDLALVDFVMPHLNGFQLCQAMRAIDNLANVPVVLMSAKADRIAESFLAQTGALDAITKPFAPEALLAVTTHALARAQEALQSAHERSDSDTTPPPPSEPPASESQERALAEADTERGVARIAERIAALALQAADGVPLLDVGSLAERIAASCAPEALFSFARELADEIPGNPGQEALAGRMDHVALGEILQLLQHQRQTGVLEVARARGTRDRASAGEPVRSVTICMSNGSVDLALGREHEQEMRLGRYLVEEEILERDELERLSRGGGPRQLLGTRLLKMGYLSAEDLRRVLVRQSSELIYEALRWRRGSYRFVRLATRPEANAARLALPLGEILMEGLRRVDEWRLIEEQLRDFDAVLRPDREALASIDVDQLRREERAVLATIDGVRSVREVVATSGMGSFEVAKILFQLLTSRLIRKPRQGPARK